MTGGAIACRGEEDAAGTGPQPPLRVHRARCHSGCKVCHGGNLILSTGVVQQLCSCQWKHSGEEKRLRSCGKFYERVVSGDTSCR